MQYGTKAQARGRVEPGVVSPVIPTELYSFWALGESLTASFPLVFWGQWENELVLPNPES